MSKSLKIVLGAIVALVVLIGGLAAFRFLRDSAEDEASVSNIATAAPAGPSAPSGRTTPDGDWRVAPGDGVYAGYRVHEKLRGLDKEVTGRTPDVSGTMTVAGTQIPAAQLTVDVTTLKTDDAMRDNAIKTRGLETNTYREATFVLTSPITLPSTPKQGEQVAATAKGNFTVHGVTKPVDVPVTARWDGDQIAVATSGGGVRVQFQDYGMDALTTPFVETADFGFFEFQLRFVPA